MGAKLEGNDLLVAAYVEQYWLTEKQIPSIQHMVETLGILTADIQKLYAKPEFQSYLSDLGIELPDDTPGLKSNLRKAGALTPKQLLVVNTMLDIGDTRSDKKKLQDYGIESTTYNAWMRDPAVQAYMRKRVESIHGDYRHLAAKALMEKVRQGDVAAIKYYNELMGIFVPSRGNNAAHNEMDIKQIMMRVVEIIQQRVKDPALQQAIAMDLMNLGKQHMIATQVVQPEVTVERVELPSALDKPVKEFQLTDVL